MCSLRTLILDFVFKSKFSIVPCCNSLLVGCVFQLLLSNWMTTTIVAADSVCVRVRIEIDQELTLERQGFEARMNLTNGAAGELTNLSVVVNFADKDKNPVLATSDPNNTTAKFFIKLSSSATLPDTLAVNAQGNFRWLIVPALAAGGADPAGELYFVGAKLSYTQGGVATTIDVQPDSIRVKPMPQLSLDYFLPYDVYGDDPFTLPVEPPIPFTLGVRVKNSGYGDANKLKIESSQPKIIDNKQGLAVKFSINGSEVNGLPATPSLLADFGTIGSNRCGMGRWSMTSTLYGRFVDFSATFTHSDDLGGTLTSLITGIQTHRLLRDVIVDLPGRDAVRDFLASDTDAIRVYESESTEWVVSDLSSSAAISGDSTGLTITAPGATAFSYIKLPDPFRGKVTLLSATRSDGKPINSNNFWFSSTYLPSTQTWDYFVNVFDTNNTSGLPYRLNVGLPPGGDVEITADPTSTIVNPGAAVVLSVSATGLDPLSYQWRKNGSPIGSPTSSNTLTITSAAEGDEASYDVIVSNYISSATSNPATITINNPVLFTTNPISKIVSQGASASFTAAATGTAPITYQWRKNGQNIPSATLASYTINTTTAEDAGVYDVVATNIVGGVPSQPASLTVRKDAPKITQQPGSKLVVIGDPSSFTVAATGTAPFTYQWLKGGKTITGATSATYTIAAVATTDAADYTVRVTNAFGSVLSDIAKLTVSKGAAYVFSTIAGSPGVAGNANGPGSSAKFNKPDQLVRDSAGNFFIADRSNHVIRKYRTDGTVETFAGLAGTPGTDDGNSSAARFSSPAGIGIDNNDNLYVADFGSHLIRKITPSGDVTRFAGNLAGPGASNGQGDASSFRNPLGIVVAPTGEVIVADYGNHQVRKILPDRTVSTLAGTGIAGTPDGPGATAQFNRPAGLAFEPTTNTLLLADEGNHAIRRIALDGQVSTFAGLKGTPGSTDSTLALSRFRSPDGITIDSDGNIFVADSGNHILRLINSSGNIRTIGGVAGSPGILNGAGALAKFSNPHGIIADANGDLFITDTDNHTLRKGTLTPIPEIATQPLPLLVGLGQRASFSVTAIGGEPLTYQWRKKGVAIKNATQSTFTINSATLADASTYSVVVTNAAGSVLSVDARLGVVDVAAKNLTINEATTLSLSLAAAGESLNYEWRFKGLAMSNGTLIAGADTTKLTVKAMGASNDGLYTCVVRMGDQSIETEGTAVTVRLKPVLNPFFPSQWIVGGIVTDSIGALNDPLTYSIKGLPPGMSYNRLTGQLSGKPTVPIKVPTTYLLTITATNAAGVCVVPLKVSVTVQPLPVHVVGTFSGLIERDPLPLATVNLSGGYGGTFKLTSTASGGFSGKVVLGAKSSSFTSGQLITTIGANAGAALSITRKSPLRNLSLEFSINKNTGELTGTITDGMIATPVNFRAWRTPWSSAAKPPAGYSKLVDWAWTYNAGLLPAPAVVGTDPGTTPPGSASNVVYPQGNGFTTLTVTSAGAASWGGKLADGVSISGSTTTGPHGEIAVHSMLYGNTGSLHGWINTSNDSTMTPANGGRPLLDGLLDWNKSTQLPASTDRAYKGGFPLHSLTVLGGKYVKPGTGQVVLEFTDDGSSNNAKFAFSEGGLTGPSPDVPTPAVMAPGLNKTFRIAKTTNVLTLPSGLANPALLKFTTFNAATGAFSGRFTLAKDPDPTKPGTLLARPVAFNGLMILRGGFNQGVGYFLLPKLPVVGPPPTKLLTSPILSGRVRLQSAP